MIIAMIMAVEFSLMSMISLLVWLPFLGEGVEGSEVCKYLIGYVLYRIP